MAHQQRRLVAIVSADVVGYSRLMEADEDGTYARLKARFQELVAPKIEAFGGRIVKLMGDGLLAEFPSVVSAVEWAVETQAVVAAANESDPPDQRIEYRIGVNLGDVIIDGDDIYGDGVNVAARLQEIAAPGGVCLADDAYRQVRGKVEEAFADGGEVSLKNISVPVRVWQWSVALGGEDGGARSSASTSPRLSDKPSIAVLPFDNLSGDPEQEYFADGVVEEIITSLSRISWLFVIARNSSFTYKGRAVDVKDVGRDLGVRYILEGSVRKAGNRLRITGQLVDASTGAHLWADRYDGSLEDIFDLQDQITASVVGAIAPKLERAEIERIKHKPTSSLDANDYYLRGMAAFYQWGSKHNPEALDYFYRAIDIDPDYAIAYAMAARSYNQRLVTDPLSFESKDRAEAERLARRAAELGRDDAIALSHAGVTLGFAVRDVRGGVSLTERARTLNPNLAVAWYADGWLLSWLGQPDTAIDHVARAIQLSPQDPSIFQMQSAMAFAHFTTADYAQAWSWSERALHDRPDHFPALIVAVASAACSDRQADTDALRDRIIGLHPGMGQHFLSTIMPYEKPEDSARWSEAIRKASFPP